MRKTLSLIPFVTAAVIVTAVSVPAANNTIINKSSVVISDGNTITDETSCFYSGTDTGKVKFVIGEAFLTTGSTVIAFNAPTYIQPDTKSTMLPLRAAATAIGNLEGGSQVKVSWQDSTKTALVSCGGKEIAFKAGSNKITVNGNSTTMTAYAEIKNGQTFVPLRALAEAFDAKVEWDANTQTVTLYK